MIPTSYKIPRKKVDGEWVIQFFDSDGRHIPELDDWADEKHIAHIQGKFRVKAANQPNKLTWRDVRG